MVGHVYDITHRIVKGSDNLVVLDDSILRGTTLKKSIIKILARFKPKKIVIVSSAPQIRYPDCYGIDMAKLGKLVAFKAAISLLNKRKDGKRVKKEFELINSFEIVIIIKHSIKNDDRHSLIQKTRQTFCQKAIKRNF